MGRHLRQVKDGILTGSWRDDLKRFQELTSAMTGEAVAKLDPEVNQKLASRWKIGNVKDEPSGPKMAAMRRIIAILERKIPSDYERGLLAALARAEDFVIGLRAMVPPHLRSPEGATDRELEKSGTDVDSVLKSEAPAQGRQRRV